MQSDGDGNRLQFLLERDGSRCMWGQNLPKPSHSS
jgi:hypothetical protein